MKTNDLNLKTIKLPDGRVLAYAEYGLTDGAPVFHFNGSGGSRLEWPGDQLMLEEIGVKFIAIDRPGHGMSDFKKHRTLIDWPKDVALLADHLSLDKFYVEGWSAGGAYALACACMLPKRVIAGAILSGIAPADRPEPYKGLNEHIKSWMADSRENPERIYPFRRSMKELLDSKSPEEVGAMLAHGESEDNLAVAKSPALQCLMGTNIKEGYRQGPQGPTEDDIIINNQWGFKLQDISARIDIWQGEIDENVPLVQGEYQHSILPNSRLRVLKNTAHIFPLIHWRKILTELIR